MITDVDLRAAVAAGKLSEAQAASLTALAAARNGYRADLRADDEPFELFRGFNEIFIVIGLLILASGWWGLTGLSVGISALSGNAGGMTIVSGAVSLMILTLLTAYFAKRRRMVAPSIALSILFTLSAAQVWTGIASVMTVDVLERSAEIGDIFKRAQWLALACGLGAWITVLLYWVWSRIPFTLAILGTGLFALAIALTALTAGAPEEFSDLFLLSAEGPFALLTLVVGLVYFVLAMRFDLSDPHRVTRRAAQGFWLHVLAAPAIVNTTAITLLSDGGTAATFGLVMFLALISLVAIVVDRRSFLIGGVGYAVGLAFTFAGGSSGVFVIILLLGVFLVALGAFWARARGAILRTLPDFPGKDRLPPYAA